MTRIVGLDPGPLKSAYCELIDGKIGAHNWLDNERLLMALRAGLTDGATAVIESPQAQDRPLGPLLRDTIWWAARYVEALDNRAAPYVESDERDDCLWLTGNPSGSNAAILAALKNHFGDTTQRACNACNGSGAVPGARPRTVKKCPGCKGGGLIKVPGPLKGLCEHECSALVAALCQQQRIQPRPQIA